MIEDVEVDLVALGAFLLALGITVVLGGVP